MEQKHKYFTTKMRGDKNDYVVYIHRNPNTEQIFYVGIGDEKRSRHMGSRSPRWKAYVNKYGKPIVEVYKSHLFEHEATYLEAHLIKLFGMRGIHANGMLVNLSTGGYHCGKGVTHSYETRMKQSLAKKGKPISEEHKRNISLATKGEKSHRTGKKASDETRRKQSLAKKGKIPPSAKKVINEKTGEIFPSGAAAARFAGYNINHFVGCLRGYLPNKTSYKYL